MSLEHLDPGPLAEDCNTDALCKYLFSRNFTPEHTILKINYNNQLFYFPSKTNGKSQTINLVGEKASNSTRNHKALKPLRVSKYSYV